MIKTYKLPDGASIPLFADMLSRPHLLIAGATGTGKSVLINGLIHEALLHSPLKTQFVLIDPKKVELTDYEHLPHTITYACDERPMIEALRQAVTAIDNRLSDMKRRRIKQFDGPRIYVIIDEIADLLTTCRKQTEPLIQRIAQIGRAAGVGLIAATQRPTSDIIAGKITTNMDYRVGLRTINKQHSRNIIWQAGCETLPDPLTEHKAECYYLHNSTIERRLIPYIDDMTRHERISYWMHTKPKYSLFRRGF